MFYFSTPVDPRMNKVKYHDDMKDETEGGRETATSVISEFL